MTADSDNGYALFCAIHDSKGNMIINLMHQRSFLLNIFMGNTIELKEAVDILSNPQTAVPLMFEENRETGDQAHREVMRYFHNFLAAAMTLVDQTRIFVRENFDGALSDAYNAKVKTEFVEDGLHRFIQDLRNYMLHKGLPNAARTVVFRNGGPTTASISITPEKLLQWNGWKADARKYLEAHDEAIDVRQLIASYETKILEFHNWLGQAILEHHEDDLATTRAMQEEYEAKYPTL